MTETAAKLDAKLSKPIEKSLEAHTDGMYAAPIGTRYVAVVELEITEHTEKGTGDIDDNGDPDAVHTTKLRPVLMELATGDDEHHLRRAFRALWTKRTAETRRGQPTIDGAADSAMAEADIRYAADLITDDR